MISFGTLCYSEEKEDLSVNFISTVQGFQIPG